MKRAFLFPGQGTQVVGMGKDIYEKYEEARKIYDKACEISGIDIKSICFDGPEDVLNKTENTQIAILTTSLAMLEVLKSNGIHAEIATGLSLGEYGALIYAGIISFEDGIRLIQKRGYYMGNLLPKEEYSMAAVIGLESSKIEEVCVKLQEQGKFVVPANYNCSSQTAISGEVNAIDEAIELGKSTIGIFTGNFENIEQMQSVIQTGGLIDGISNLIDTVISKVSQKGIINSNIANILNQGKNIILNNVESNIEKTFAQQLESMDNLENYINAWKEDFEKKDFNAMEKSYNKLEKELKNLVPIDNIINQAKIIENLHKLIKNNGQNFKLTAEEIELSNKLI